VEGGGLWGELGVGFFGGGGGVWVGGGCFGWGLGVGGVWWGVEVVGGEAGWGGLNCVFTLHDEVLPNLRPL